MFGNPLLKKEYRDYVVEYFKYYEYENMGLIDKKFSPKNPYLEDFLAYVREEEKRVNELTSETAQEAVKESINKKLIQAREEVILRYGYCSGKELL